MTQYNILNDFEKQQKLKDIEKEKIRLKKPKYWILKQMSVPKSTYYDWVKCGGKSKSKEPHTIWNKTSKEVEGKILEFRDDRSVYKSQRSPVGIVTRLEDIGVLMTSVGVWEVLKRNGKNREFVEEKDLYIIYPKSEKFLGVVCIDDMMLTKKKPRDTAIFNAIDEFAQESVAISHIPHRSNRYDVTDVIQQIKDNYGRFPDTIRLDNAKVHISHHVKEFCEENNIKLQFIDKGVPQQNWPVESFNGVLKKDILKGGVWKWHETDDVKQQILVDYREYYNTQKRLDSDPIKRTPREISTAITSQATQDRLKLKLLRKHRGQVAAHQYMTSNSLFTASNLSEMCVN